MILVLKPNKERVLDWPRTSYWSGRDAHGCLKCCADPKLKDQHYFGFRNSKMVMMMNEHNMQDARSFKVHTIFNCLQTKLFVRIQIFRWRFGAQDGVQFSWEYLEPKMCRWWKHWNHALINSNKERTNKNKCYFVILWWFIFETGRFMVCMKCINTKNFVKSVE